MNNPTPDHKRPHPLCTALLLTAILLPVSFISPAMGSEPPKIGLALGGGGANGLAHIAILEVFDELDIRPHRIAGTSIGAIMGALYASGMSAKEIRELVDTLVATGDDTWQALLMEGQLFRWISFLDPGLGEGGLMKADKFITFLRDAVKVDRFEDLSIPLQVITTDMNTQEQVVLASGSLSKAVQASMAVPGIFTPVIIGERTLVDGGLVNPVPFDLLFESCDLVVAVNVIGNIDPANEPTFMESTFIAIRIFQNSILREKMQQRAPSIYIDTQIKNIQMLEFYKFDEVDEQVQPAAQQLRTELKKRLAH